MRSGIAFVLVWFSAAFTLSAMGWFERFSAATLFGIGAAVSATGFAVLHRLSEKFRGFLRARSLKRLTWAQTLRFYGVLALVKSHQGVLPAIFAIPTGIIDVFFAATSFFVAARLITSDGHPRPGFFAWHVAGLAGLSVSVLLAVLHSSSAYAMTWFPMSLVPVFIGPLVLIFHLLALTAAHPHYRAPPASRL